LKGDVATKRKAFDMRDDAYETIRAEQRGFVRWITLNRPERRNAISPQMIEELETELERARTDPDVRVLALAAAGRAFCSGADLGDSPDARPDASTLEAATALYNRIEDFPHPVVGVVQGVACAGGLELLLCCDLIVAAESVRIADIHSNVGLIPGAGGAYRLVRRIGPSAAKWLMYTGDFFAAAELRDLGLISQVVPDDELTAAAEELTGRLAAKSPLGLAAMKRLADRALDSDRSTAMAEGLNESLSLMDSEDYLEGLAAMQQGRPAIYAGR